MHEPSQADLTDLNLCTSSKRCSRRGYYIYSLRVAERAYTLQQVAIISLSLLGNKAHCRRSSRVQFLKEPIWNWFESNCILELHSTLVPSMILGSPKQELSPFLALFFGLNQLIFPPKQVPCRFSLNLPLFGFRPSFKGLGINLKLLTNKIAWTHWSLDPRLKSP